VSTRKSKLFLFFYIVFDNFILEEFDITIKMLKEKVKINEK